MGSSDFVADEKPDERPDARARTESLMPLKPGDPRFQRLVKLLIERKVVLTSTPAVFEWFGGILGAGGVPLEGLDMLAQELRARLMAPLIIDDQKFNTDD